MKPKIFCKICFDSDQSEQMYISHNIKDKYGCVICPTLRNHVCSYCKKIGHYKKYCPLLSKESTKSNVTDKYPNKYPNKYPDRYTNIKHFNSPSHIYWYRQQEIVSDKLKNIFNQMNLIPPNSTNWADMADIDDYEKEIEILTTQLKFINKHLVK